MEPVDLATPRSWTRSVAAGGLLTGLALGVVVAGIAGLAQRAGRAWLLDQGLSSQEINSLEVYSLPLHTAAMTAVGLLAVAAASLLVLTGRRLMAAVTLIGAAIGPMTLVAAPVAESLIRDDSMDTVAGWHVLVGALLMTIMGVGTWWTSRSLRSWDGRPAELPLSDISLFALTAAACLTAQVPMMGSHERPQLVVALGWSLLIAGTTVVGTMLRGWQTAAATVGSGLVLLLMALAYIRVGGWPGVAGWEFMGMQSPVILTFVSAGAYAAGPLTGFLAANGGRSNRRVPAAVG